MQIQPLVRAAVAITALLFAGCVREQIKPPTDKVGDALVAAAQRVDSAWSESNSVLKATSPSVAPSQEPADLPAALAARIDLSWYGPLTPAVAALASYAHYAFEEIGIHAGAPILVSLEVKNGSVFDALRSAGIQAGTQADVSLDPVSHRIQIVYRDAPPVSAAAPSVATSKPKQAVSKHARRK